MVVKPVVEVSSRSTIKISSRSSSQMSSTIEVLVLLVVEVLVKLVLNRSTFNFSNISSKICSTIEVLLSSSQISSKSTIKFSS